FTAASPTTARAAAEAGGTLRAGTAGAACNFCSRGKGCPMRKKPVLGLAGVFLAGVAMTGCNPQNRTGPQGTFGGGGTSAMQKNSGGWNTRQTDVAGRGMQGSTGMVDATGGTRQPMGMSGSAGAGYGGGTMTSGAGYGGSTAGAGYGGST